MGQSSEIFDPHFLSSFEPAWWCDCLTVFIHTLSPCFQAQSKSFLIETKDSGGIIKDKLFGEK